MKSYQTRQWRFDDPPYVGLLFLKEAECWDALMVDYAHEIIQLVLQSLRVWRDHFVNLRVA